MNLFRSIFIGLFLSAAPVLFIKSYAEVNNSSFSVVPTDYISNFASGAVPSIGEALSDWQATPQDHVGGQNSLWNTISYESQLPSTGSFYYEGSNTYTIYETGIPGIGIVLRISNDKTDKFRFSVAIQDTTANILYHNTAIDGAYDSFVNVTYWAKLVTTGVTPSPQKYTISPQRAGTLSFTNGFGYNPTTVTLNDINMTVGNKGCRADSVASTIMAPASLNRFIGVGTVVPTTDVVTINLSCDADTAVYGVMSDGSNRGNISNVLTVQSPVDLGVGIQFLYSTSTGFSSAAPITFGPDASWIGADGNFPIKSSIDPNDVTLTLIPQYYQTNPSVEVGKFTAIATLTLAYE